MNRSRKSYSIHIIDISVHSLSLEQYIEQIMSWAEQNMSRSVCVANVHMLMEAYWDLNFHRILSSADLVTPDGMPLVWMMRCLGADGQERAAGMDLLKALCQKAQERNLGVFFLGSQAQVLTKIHQRLKRDYLDLNVVGMEPLPFRPLNAKEDQDIINQINRSGAGLLFVSLGCPKQEKWIADHRNKINATMIGLGGVFPVYAGLQKYAPRWIRNLGMEWAYRLIQEPSRLWRRYATTIPTFLWLAAKQLITDKRWRPLPTSKRKGHIRTVAGRFD